MAKTHKKLASGSSMLDRTYLYDAGDHLLSVRGSYRENYRRFFYHDIEAVLIREKRATTVVSGIFLLLLLIGTLYCFYLGDVFIVMGSLLAFVTLLAFASALPKIVSGGYCDCYIATRVQVEQVPSLGSVGKANKVKQLIAKRVAEQTPPVMAQEAAQVSPQVTA